MSVPVIGSLALPINCYVNFWPNHLRTLKEQNATMEAESCEDPGQVPIYTAAEAVTNERVTGKNVCGISAVNMGNVH